MDLPSHASSHGFGAAMTATRMRKPRPRSTNDLSSVLNGVLNSAETLIWLGAITTRCEARSSSSGKRILHAHQAFVHVENNAVDMERKMTFQQGVSGNPHGNRHRTRHLLNQEFMQAL